MLMNEIDLSKEINLYCDKIKNYGSIKGWVCGLGHGINKETPEQRVDDWEFAPGDIIGLDVYVSTGEGIGKEIDARTTVYKREIDT
jgi:hypothetical protein